MGVRSKVGEILGNVVKRLDGKLKASSIRAYRGISHAARDDIGGSAGVVLVPIGRCDEGNLVAEDSIGVIRTNAGTRAIFAACGHPWSVEPAKTEGRVHLVVALEHDVGLPKGAATVSTSHGAGIDKGAKLPKGATSKPTSHGAGLGKGTALIEQNKFDSGIWVKKGVFDDKETIGIDEKPKTLSTRNFVEVCCGPNSLLGKVKSYYTGGCQRYRVTEDHDLTKQETLDAVLSKLRDPRDCVWISIPCTGGCPGMLR